MEKNFINCTNAKEAEAKVVFNFFNQYELENDLPGETRTDYYSSVEEMLDSFNYQHREGFGRYRVYHYELYVRELNSECAPVGGWNKVEGGYSQGYYKMMAQPVAR